MNEYKRLTARLSNDKYTGACWNCEKKKGLCTDEKCLGVMKKRLGELEDKIEQGLLIELPCKIGDTVYAIVPKCKDINKCSEFDQHICSRSNCDWHIRETKFSLSMLNYIGDHYFTTKEKAKAEAKLAELRGEK